MTLTTRLSAGFLALSLGVCAPLAALATPQDAGEQPFAHHTSSRMVAYQTDRAEGDMEALRAQLWALTAQGGTENCNVDGITAPCAAVKVSD